MTAKKISVLVGGALLVAVLAGVAISQSSGGEKVIPPQPRDFTFDWTAPTTGTPVVRYDVEIRIGGPESDQIETRSVTTNEVTFSVDWVTIYEVRVRGVDAQGRVGPWSPWSLAEDRDLDDPEDFAN